MGGGLGGGDEGILREMGGGEIKQREVKWRNEWLFGDGSGVMCSVD